MATQKKKTSVPADALATARKRAEQTRQQLEKKPSPTELLTPQELADAAPFYIVLREYIRQLKEAREFAGLTLADVSARSGLAVESLSRLETGAQTNPTWKTLGTYAVAVDRQPQLAAVAITPDGEKDIGDEKARPPTQTNRGREGGQRQATNGPVIFTTGDTIIPDPNQGQDILSEQPFSFSPAKRISVPSAAGS
jgi:transcriptional regulator with XRE-family HTH domain